MNYLQNLLKTHVCFLFEYMNIYNVLYNIDVTFLSFYVGGFLFIFRDDLISLEVLVLIVFPLSAYNYLPFHSRKSNFWKIVVFENKRKNSYWCPILRRMYDPHKQYNHLESWSGIDHLNKWLITVGPTQILVVFHFLSSLI